MPGLRAQQRIAGAHGMPQFLWGGQQQDLVSGA
jgi:hypothetical protein